MGIVFSLGSRTMLDVTQKQKVSYCIPIWLRDEQIKLAIQRVKGRIEGVTEKREEPCAVVGFGPSLNETWEKVKDFKYIFSCSGSHKFLLERGIVPTWHVEVDPREHKVALIGTPHKDVTYLIASTCHPKVLDHLEGYNVKLWHVFDTEAEGIRTLPHGEWALTGGCDVGLRAMTIARFFGFTDLHLFGIDGSSPIQEKRHADTHPKAFKLEAVEQNGRTFYSSAGMLAAAQGIWHELNQMPDVKPTFYGDGLIQEMAKSYQPKPIEQGPAIGFRKPELISAEYRELNYRLHRENLAYGIGGGRHADTVEKLAKSVGSQSVLDYGCGKGYLAKELNFPIWEYDPAIPGKDESPRPSDIVVCTDVLEHIEPEKIDDVLYDIKRCLKKVGYLIINTGPAHKTLPDGRNTHLLQRDKQWWTERLQRYFTVGKVFQVGAELHVIVGPKVKKKKAA